MTEKLMFDVRVQRATPVCSENCPNLQIDANHEEVWSASRRETIISKYKCINADYCANLWRTMRTMMEEK